MPTQVSVKGHVLQGLVVGLCGQNRISIATACGCIRQAYVSRETSLAMTDLWTATFFCELLMITATQQNHPAPMDALSLRELYSSCSVSLLDILPLVSFDKALGNACQLRSPSIN